MSIFGQMSSIFGKAAAAACRTGRAGVRRAAFVASLARLLRRPLASHGSRRRGRPRQACREQERKRELDWRKSDRRSDAAARPRQRPASARKELAQELHYSGDMKNSASMNAADRCDRAAAHAALRATHPFVLTRQSQGIDFGTALVLRDMFPGFS